MLEIVPKSITYSIITIYNYNLILYNLIKDFKILKEGKLYVIKQRIFA